MELLQNANFKIQTLLLGLKSSLFSGVLWIISKLQNGSTFQCGSEGNIELTVPWKYILKC